MKIKSPLLNWWKGSCILLGISAATWGFAASQLKELYVAPEIATAVSPDGSIARPYDSIHRAVTEVRGWREAGLTAPVVIYLRGGRHQLKETVVLGLQDGNPSTLKPVSMDKPGAGELVGPAYLTIAAYPGETPVVSAGVPVTGWKKPASLPAEMPASAAGKVWVADMPQGLGKFFTLYDQQGRLNRARNAGFFPEKPGDKKILHFPKGALKNWENLSDVEIHVRPGRAWSDNMLPLASVDEASGVAQTAVSASYELSLLQAWVHNPLGASVWVENIVEALDEPGEWVVNTKTRKIYLWPADPAPDGSPRGILAPSTSELIRVEGAIDYEGPTDTPVRGIAFSGLTFSHGDRLAWTNEETRLGWGMQHDWDMFDKPTALLRFRGAEDCRVTDCRFVDSGGSGVRMDLYAQRNRVIDCEFARLGEAGILLAGYGPGKKDVNHHNEITNNDIHHFSEISWDSPGIWAWQSGHNRIAHNDIHHSGYAAVLITTRVTPGQRATGEGGMTVRRNEIDVADRDLPRDSFESWQAREKYTHSRRNLVEYNDISHTVERLSDGNAIYVSGAGAGNIVRYNFLHDNLAHSMPAAIRCDDDQNDTLIFGNILYHNFGFSAGIASKGTNHIINNFIVDPQAPPKSGYLSFEWVPVTGSKVSRNIVVSHREGGNAANDRPRATDGPDRPKPNIEETEMNGNLYYHPADPHWMDAHFLRMRAVGKEQASLFGEPLFKNPAGGDFSFQAGSPALALGIEPLDATKMGRQPKRSLLISDGGQFVPKAFYPKFSWDTTPLYFMFQDKARVLSPEEVEFIAARTDFLCIEKSHGKAQLGAAELGAKHEAAAFKKAKPDSKVLFYFNSAYAWPYTSYNKDFTTERIGAHPELKRFLIADPETGELAQKNGAFCFDVLQPEFREWWVDTVAKGVRESGCDGVFIDQMHGNNTLRRDKRVEIEKAMGDMMAALKQKLGPDQILLGNNACNDDAKFVYPVCDAIMFENYANVRSSKENLLVEWGDMLRNAQEGKISVFRLGVEGTGRGNLKPADEMPKLAQEKLEFALACYLIGAQPYSYFMYSWGWLLSTGPLVDFPELQKPLGAPRTAYKRTTPEGWEFTREFEHASVWVNTESRQAKITWR